MYKNIERIKRRSEWLIQAYHESSQTRPSWAQQAV